MISKYLAARSAKKTVKFWAKKEFHIVMTSVLTLATQRLLQKVARKYPSMKFMKPLKGES